ncbi:zinc finger protein 62-like [Chironomus tepperi]|uniref:zinc finger protein 62-like n=1 Tax=Chironomus tepperi TaxID=113505 RepID=UPI00391FC986
MEESKSNIELFGEEIVCEKCGNNVNKLDYDRHLKTHKEKRVETCNICFKKFTNLSNFKYHLSHHSDERNFICDECPKSYKTKIDLLQHKRVHEKIKEPLSCEICHEKFSFRSKYNSHLRTHTIKGPLNCELCGKMFVNLRSHIQQVHQKIRNHKCSICDKEFGKRSGLVRHIMTVHEKMKCWTCDVCEKSFGEKTQLLRHRQTHLKNRKLKVDIDGPKNEESEIVEEVFIIKEELEDSNECIHETWVQNNTDESLKEEKIESTGYEIEVLDEFKDSLILELPEDITCHICLATFKQKRYLQSHMRTVHKGDSEKSLVCKFCPEKFTHRTQRLRHIRQSHPEVYEQDVTDQTNQTEELSNRTCNLCNKVFKQIKYLELHLTSFHKSELYECDLCQRTFTFKRSMERHIRAIHEDRRDYKCQEPACLKAFRSQYELNEHFKNIHEKIKRNEPLEDVTCDVCEKICSSKKSLYSHKKLVHEGVKWNENFECKICLEKFDTKYMKVKHSYQVHKNGEIKLRTCHLCSLQFQFFDDFKTHVESHKGCFICMICGHNFDDESLLFIHIESHKKIEEEFRQFICDICSHALSTKSQLHIHMRKHSSEDHYVCDECGKSYKFLAPFLHHKIVHENKFDYICSYCNKAFRKLRDKDLHERTHSGVRPYKCHICEKTFALKPNYLNHMKTHQPKYFECKICHVHQSSSVKLREHEMIEHPEEFPFKCPSCGKLFKISHTFEDHKEKCYEKLS